MKPCAAGHEEPQQWCTHCEVRRLERTIDVLLASAGPNPRDHPTMAAAWGIARAVRGLPPL